MFGIEGYILNEKKAMIDDNRYNINTIPDNISIDGDRVIEFYYKKSKAKAVIRTFIVNRTDDTITGIIKNSEREVIVNAYELQEYAVAKSDKYEYLGCNIKKNEVPIVNMQTLDDLDAEKTVVNYELADGEIEYIDFYYLNQEYTYSAQIKYIDDTTNEVLYKVDNDKMEKNAIFPNYGTIASRYLIKDLKGTLGLSGYELMDKKVIIDDDNYTINTMPDTLIMNEDKTIEFYYRKENADANIRTFIVTKTDNKITGVKNNSQYTHSAYANVEYKKEAPVLPNYKYLGYRISYGDNPVITSSVIDGLDPNQTLATYRLQQDNQRVYVDFIYLEEYYTVTVKYQDTYGNSIRDDIVEVVKSGNSIIPDVPDTITANSTTYDYVSRNDGKVQDDIIGPVKNKTIVIVKYKSRGHTVRIKYRDIISNEQIAPDVVEGNIPEYSKYKPTEDGVSSKYIFVTRSDGKARKAEIEITTFDKEVIFYYVNSEGAPVVAYPEITTNYKESGKSVAVLGEEIQVTIPSKGTHNQMHDLGINEPSNGWNSVYAKSEYLKFSCDVLFNGEIVKAGELIKISSNVDGGIGNTSIKVIIPEYVKGETQKVTAIVSNLIQNKKQSSNNVGYNELYNENEAVNTIEFKVRGKLYDFTITNLVGDNFWPTSLFNNINGYKAGLNATNKISSLPIGQRDHQNKLYKYGIALGSSFYFNLNTIGVDNEKISIVPKLIYIDNDGNQKDVDIYYKNSSNKYVAFPQLSELELTTKINSDAYKSRTNITNEMQKGIKLFSDVIYNTASSIGTYKEINLTKNEKTPFINYISEENKTQYNSLSETIKNEILKSANHWYGYYSLPYTTMVMEKGANTNDSSKEIKTGFIIVLFKITSKNSSGNTYLVYDNQIQGNMWKIEGGSGNGENLVIQLPVTASSNGKNTTINVVDGYYPVAIYGAGTRLNYDTASTH